MPYNDYDAYLFALNGTSISGCTAVDTSPNIETTSPASDGDGAESFHATNRLAPAMDATLLNLMTLLPLFGAFPFAIPLTGAGAVSIDRKALNNGVGYDGTSVHEQTAIALGMAALTGIEFPSEGADCSATVRVVGRSSDGTAPSAVLSTVAAPAPPGAVAPLVLDSVAIDSVITDAFSGGSLALDPAWRIGHGPLLYPIHVGVAQGAPATARLSLTVRDASVMRARSLLTGSEKQITVTLKTKAQGGVRGTSTITIVTNAGMLIPGSKRSATGDGVSQTFEHRPRRNGATLPVTITVTP